MSVALVAVAIGLVFSARALQDHVGSGISPESIQAWAHGSGWKSLAMFVGLVTFRQFLLLPSAVVLTAGGLAFGAKLGALLGGLGILLSATMNFAVARAIGREWLRPRLGERFRRFEARMRTASIWVVEVATAHPTGPMWPTHCAAGFSTISAFAFLVTVAPAGLLRAGAWSFFGFTFVEWGSPRSIVALAVLGAAVALPLAHPGVRRRLFGPGAGGASSGPTGA